MNYRTIKNKVEFEGIGIHSGRKSKIIVEPAKEYSGVNFWIGGIKIPAELGYVIDTTRATVLGNNNFQIFTVEHLLSSIYGLVITDLNIYVLGDEIPIYDGSAKFFVETFLDAGLIETRKINEINVKEKFEFNVNNSKYIILPSDNFEIECEIYSKESSFLNGQKFCLEFSPENYIKEISYAKTYCFLKDVPKIQSSGYGLGGGSENTIVINDDKIINPEILTYKNECARHKILDFLGDFFLLNMYVKVKIKIINPGHYCNFEFCKKMKKFLKMI